MAHVRVLPPHIVNRIAAGEVVERPASVIKELVENSIDAGATKIEIAASAGGRTLRVSDNGSGMDEENARLAFLNHATSKIQSLEDLDAIDTLGFRGEALASISAVARVTCITRQPDADTGIKLYSVPGQELEVTPVGTAPGTRFEVEDLFYNIPARLKFLKKPQTELGHIEELVQSLALSHPHIQFQLFFNEDKKPVLKTSGSGTLRMTLAELFGDELKDLKNVPEKDDTVFPVALEGSVGTISGYVASPGALGLLKSSKRYFITFVNHRVVKCPVLNRAIESAYQSLIPEQKYPFAALFIHLPHGDVDVNVHPGKREVRYAQPNQVFQMVHGAVRQSLEQFRHTLIPQAMAPNGGLTPLGGASIQGAAPVISNGSLSFSASFRGGGANGGGHELSRPSTPSASLNRESMNLYAPIPTQLNLSPSRSQDNEEPLDLSGHGSLHAGRPWRVIGQLFNTFILLETPQGLMVVDQHIASERACFEMLQRQHLDQELAVQTLMTGIPIALTPTQRALLQEHPGVFQGLGFGWTWEENAPALTLSQVPTRYPGRTLPHPEGWFMDVLHQVEERGEGQLPLDELFATLSCHMAVRAGDPLRQEEMEKVIELWLEATLPWTCPHGRPIAHTISSSELNRFFERPSLPVNAFGA